MARKKKALPDSPLAALNLKPTRKTKTRKTKTAKTAPAKGKAAASAGGRRPRTIYLDQDLDRRLRIAAAEADESVSDLIAAAVAAFLKG